MNSPQAIVLGITGGIASGKTEAGRILSAEGFKVLDSDFLAHELMGKGRPVYEAVIGYFGGAILGENVEIDRTKLGKKIFADPEERAALNQLVHPSVITAAQEWIKDCREMKEDAAVLVPSRAPAARTLKALVKSLGETPWGLWSEGDGQNLKALDSAGVDFVVFAPDKMPLASAGEEKPGRVVGIPLDLEDSLARTVSELPVDAVIINSPGTAALTFQDLMRFRRLGDWISKPLLAVVPVSLNEGEIKALWDAGIDALVVTLTAENQATFKELRTTLDETALTTKRKWMKARAIVPVVRQEEAKPEPDEGGDGDDE